MCNAFNIIYLYFIIMIYDLLSIYGNCFCQYCIIVKFNSNYLTNVHLECNRSIRKLLKTTIKYEVFHCLQQHKQINAIF